MNLDHLCGICEAEIDAHCKDNHPDREPEPVKCENKHFRWKCENNADIEHPLGYFCNECDKEIQEERNIEAQEYEMWGKWEDPHIDRVP